MPGAAFGDGRVRRRGEDGTVSRPMQTFINILTQGLGVGAIYLLGALGLTIIYGVMGVINLAHGEFIMLGSYVIALLAGSLTSVGAIILAPLIVGAIGYVTDIVLIRFLYHKPVASMLGTWGLGLVIRQSVTLVFGADLRYVVLPLTGSFSVGYGATFSEWRAVLIGAAAVTAGLVALIIRKTKFGLKMRAVIGNADTSQTLGLRVARVNRWSFTLGCALAGLAGALVAPLRTVFPGHGHALPRRRVPRRDPGRARQCAFDDRVVGPDRTRHRCRRHSGQRRHRPDRDLGCGTRDHCVAAQIPPSGAGLMEPRPVDLPRRFGLARLAPRGRRTSTATAVIFVVLGVVFGFTLSEFALSLMALFFAFAVLAYSLDLLWGENRIVSFGHGAFFVAGGYVGGLILLGRPYDIVGGHTNFLLEETNKPVFNQVLEALNGPSVEGVPFLALIIPPLVTGLVGLLIGLVVFRVGSPEVYIPLVTLGIGVIAALEFNDVEVIGASNGLGGVPGFTDGFDGGHHSIALYGFNGAFLTLIVLGYWRFRRSRLGLIWRSSGDDPIRLEALGYRIRLVRALGFAASTALAGFAGVLYISASHYIGPQTAGVLFSAQALIWVAVGGVGTLLGPLVGVLAVKWGEQYLSSELGLEESWPLLLGIILIVVVIVAPRGLAGTGEQLRELRQRIGRGEQIRLRDMKNRLRASGR